MLNLLLNIDNSITATIDLVDGFGLINTGFPNGRGTNYGFAFNDNLGAANLPIVSLQPAIVAAPPPLDRVNSTALVILTGLPRTLTWGTRQGRMLFPSQSPGLEGSIAFKISSVYRAVISTLPPMFFTTGQILRGPAAGKAQSARA